jgi:hypothetical protein
MIDSAKIDGAAKAVFMKWFIFFIIFEILPF